MRFRRRFPGAPSIPRILNIQFFPIASFLTFTSWSIEAKSKRSNLPGIRTTVLFVGARRLMGNGALLPASTRTEKRIRSCCVCRIRISCVRASHTTLPLKRIPLGVRVFHFPHIVFGRFLPKIEAFSWRFSGWPANRPILDVRGFHCGVVLSAGF